MQLLNCPRSLDGSETARLLWVWQRKMGSIFYNLMTLADYCASLKRGDGRFCLVAGILLNSKLYNRLVESISSI
jgi:hypothetical protein